MPIPMPRLKTSHILRHIYCEAYFFLLIHNSNVSISECKDKDFI